MKYNNSPNPVYSGKRIVKGRPAILVPIHDDSTISSDSIIAPTVICNHSLSFLGDIDIKTGNLINPNHPNYGTTIQNKIIAFTSSKGSSSGCVILSSMANQGKGPAAIITLNPADYNIVEGAILGNVPFIAEMDPRFFSEIKTGTLLQIHDHSCYLYE